MAQYLNIDEKSAVAGQLQPSDLPQLAAEGFKVIINNRPEGESFGQPTAGDMATEAARQGLTFANLPFAVPARISPEQVAEFARLFRESDGKVLAYCRSGMRSAVIWAAAMAALGVPLTEILAKTAKIGFDLRQAAGFIEDLGVAATRS